MSMKETDRRWLPAERDALASEAIGGPSLTYWQDCWHRLCRNKTALLSMVVVVIVVLSAIFVPMFWPYSYEEQDLRYANIPPELEIYDLGGNSFVYVTSDYKCIDTDGSGHLLGASTLVKDDKAGRTYLYEINGKDLLVDYGVYFRAKSEFITQEAAHGDGSPVTVAEVEYLREYYGEDAPETVSLREAEHILEDKIDRFRVFYDGAQITPAKTVLNKTYIWGTDSLGRDLFIRIVYGARISLLVGFFAAFINFVVGVFYGAIAGYAGGQTDNIMMRITDVLYTIPDILLIILLGMALKEPLESLATKPGFKWMQTLGPNMISIFIIFALLYWVSMARIVRSQILILKESEYVTAARALGASSGRIIKKHLLTNCIGTLIVTTTLQIPASIFTESYLSFIGLGVAAPLPSLGSLATDAVKGMNTYPHLLIAPALMISVMILVFNLFGDGLRDAFDPKLKN